MNDRLQRALDGELSRDDLTPAELDELLEHEAVFENILHALPSPQIPGLGQAVLDRIEATQPQARAPKDKSTGILRWLWSPTRIPVRPAYVMALAAVIALVVGIGGKNSSKMSARATVATAPEVMVHFTLEAPAARAVSLAGDFNNWSPTVQMKQSAPGVWSVVVPLGPGVHDYSFIIDGEKWVPDPAAPARADGFGGMNSRIAVLAPDAGRSL